MSNSLEVQRLRPGDPTDEWDEFVTRSPQGSIFCRAWWLDAVCPGQYELLVLRKGQQIVAGMPLHRSREWGFEALHMPPLTQVLGPLLPPPASLHYERNLSGEMEVLRSLVQALPTVSQFNTHCHHSLTNWLPFYWEGYKQTTLYTYAFEDLSDLQKVFEGFHHSKRKNIKRAEETVDVREDLPAEAFFANHQLTLSKQHDRVSYSRELFLRLHAAAVARGAGKTWYAVDREGQLHAAIFVVFDAKSAYYLVSSIDPDHRNSGAATLLVKRAMEYLAPRTQRFDFEGSMIEGVETSFRRFGARQVPYFALTRSGALIAPLLAGRQLLRRVRR